MYLLRACDSPAKASWRHFSVFDPFSSIALNLLFKQNHYIKASYFFVARRLLFFRKVSDVFFILFFRRIIEHKFVDRIAKEFLSLGDGFRHVGIKRPRNMNRHLRLSIFAKDESIPIRGTESDDGRAKSGRINKQIIGIGANVSRIWPNMLFRVNGDSALLLIAIPHRFFKGLFMLQSRDGEAAKHHDDLLKQRNGNCVAIGDDIASFWIGQKALNKPAVTNLGVVAIEENASSKERTDVFLSFHLDSIANFADEPQDGESQKVVKNKGKDRPQEVVFVQIAESFGKTFLLYRSSGEIVRQGVFVINDFRIAFHKIRLYFSL